jgi:signal transduction histidine kinase/ActR/RegA family two-component response regulator
MAFSVKSLSFRVIQILVSVAASIMVYVPVLAFLQVNYIEQADNNLAVIKETTEALSVEVLASALENGNTELVGSTLQHLRDLTFVHSVNLLDGQGRGIDYQDGSLPEVDGISSKEIPIHLSVLDGSTGNTIGRLIISYSSNTTDGYNFFALENLLFSLLIGLVAAFLLFLFFRRLYNNFSHIAESAKNLAEGNKGIRLTEQNKVKELSEFSTSFNLIAKALEARRKESEEQQHVFDMKNNILQVAAHELRTPITSIKTYLDMALDYSQRGKLDRVVATLKKAFSDVDSLDQHVIAILALSALENGSLTRNDRWTKISSFFGDFEKQFSVKCRSKRSGVDWCSFGKGDFDCDMLIDVDLASVIISNAINNAIKYTNIGFVKVTYEVVQKKLVVIVQDTGIGIGEDDLIELMGRPNQLLNHIKRKADGWGIGMATMFKFSDFLGGDIKIESIFTFGTKVTISLPIETKARKGQDSNIRPPLKPDRQSRASYLPSTYVQNITEGGLSILIVDNDTAFLSQMEELFSPEFLRRGDVQVTLSPSSSEAIRQVEENEYDLILIDYHMPGEDGLQLLKFVASNEHRAQNAKRFILTADANIPKDIRSEMEALSDGIMSKGLTNNDVLELLRKVSVKMVS